MIKPASKLFRCFSALLSLFIISSACSSPHLLPQKAIVGKWVNPQGGQVYFYQDGTGFIPGLTGTDNIPDVKFTYRFPDDQHLALTLPGQPALVIEIILDGDRMTWRGATSGKKFVYTRSQ